MIDLDLDMRQYDCPFIDTTDDVGIAFSALQWQVDTDAEKLEVRLIAEAASRGTLDRGLGTLRDHRNMTDYHLLSKRDNVAIIRTVIELTNAMRTINRHDGYITGPFHIEDGTERWHVGFDNEETADWALSALDDENEFEVEERKSLEVTDLFDLIEHANVAVQLLDSCRNLTDTERKTLERAVEVGFYETPRGASLDDLADHFDVSKTAVSMNLRRGERKVLEETMDAATDLDR